MSAPTISVERLQKAILIWEAANQCYKDNMAQIKKDHMLTWFLRPSYWKNERYFHRGFTAIIKRRIQLQTAIRQHKEN